MAGPIVLLTAAGAGTNAIMREAAAPRRWSSVSIRAINSSHDCEGIQTFGSEAAVEGRPTDSDQGALARDRQLRVTRFDCLASLPPLIRRRKESRSSASWTIMAGTARSRLCERRRPLPPCPRRPWPFPRQPASFQALIKVWLRLCWHSAQIRSAPGGELLGPPSLEVRRISLPLSSSGSFFPQSELRISPVCGGHAAARGVHAERVK